MPFRFEDLKVWNEALRLCNTVDQLTAGFPKSEIYCLSSQMKRVADSVVLNIAEGSAGQSKPEFRRFLRIALRSAIKVVACLFIARSRAYLQEEIFKNLYGEYELLCKRITSLIKAVS